MVIFSSLSMQKVKTGWKRTEMERGERKKGPAMTESGRGSKTRSGGGEGGAGGSDIAWLRSSTSRRAEERQTASCRTRTA